MIGLGKYFQKVSQLSSNVTTCNAKASEETPILSIPKTFPFEVIREKLKISEKHINMNEVLIQFKCYTIPLTINIDEDVCSFIIKGIRIKDCLNLHVKMREKTGYLANIDTVGGLCPLPFSRTGTFMLELVDMLAVTFNLRSINLGDASGIVFKKEDGRFKTAMLTHLRTFQTGQGWYESHGYHPHERDYSEYRQRVEINLNYPISKLMTEVERNYSGARYEFARNMRSSSPEARIVG